MRISQLIVVGLIAVLVGCGGETVASTGGIVDERRVLAASRVLSHACQPEVKRQAVQSAVRTLLDAYRRAPGQRLSGLHGDGPSGTVPITVADEVHAAAVDFLGCPRFPTLQEKMDPALPEGVVADPPKIPPVPPARRAPSEP